MNYIVKNQKSKTFSSMKLIVSCLAACIITFSCNYLDIVPNDIPTIDHAYINRTEAMKCLYSLLGGMPEIGGGLAQDPAILGSDEVWLSEIPTTGLDKRLRRIMTGEQGPANPVANYWSSIQFYTHNQLMLELDVVKPLWTLISDCNIFLENIHKPFDMKELERDKWRGEALFIKAFAQYWLLRQYGPIPINRENFPISYDTEEMSRYREPVDEAVDYIVELLDEAMPKLPIRLEDETLELGRPTRCVAAALKAHVLTLAASPLYNCNTDYADFIDGRGVQLFPQDKSAEKGKWKRAADAAKEAIDIAHSGFYRLYDARRDMQYAEQLSNETVMAMQVRGAVTERWNDEIIWGNSKANGTNQALCMPYFSIIHQASNSNIFAPPLHIVEQFYTKNGLPIEDDEDWVGKDPWALRTATEADRQYIRQGMETIQLHFDREARFYGAISFDQGTFYGNGRLTEDNTTSSGYMYVTEFKFEQMNGYWRPQNSSLTGYLCKKLISTRSSFNVTSTNPNIYLYAHPIFRLADLYLLYAEALNEWKDVPDAEVYEYIDRVRERTGLKGVVESWEQHAVAGKKNLPSTQAGMRDIIRRERLNELAFEGHRYWDLRRWKLAESYINNRPIRGLNVLEKEAADFYKETVLYTPKFEKKDYFSPISMDVVVVNTHLVQNPGW